MATTLSTLAWLQHYRTFRTDKLRGGLSRYAARADPDVWVASIAEALQQHGLATKQDVRMPEYCSLLVEYRLLACDW